METPPTKWVATVRSRGAGVFHVEAATPEKLDQELGDIQDMLGALVWSIEERPAAFRCDGKDACSEPPAREEEPPAEVDQLALDL
jgi:hypothetical protein